MVDLLVLPIGSDTNEGTSDQVFEIVSGPFSYGILNTIAQDSIVPSNEVLESKLVELSPIKNLLVLKIPKNTTVTAVFNLDESVLNSNIFVRNI